MKKIFLLLCPAVLIALTQIVNAQENKITNSKTDEIVIRKNSDKDVKVTVEMKNDEVLVNGKPLSAFNDDNVSVIQRKKFIHKGNRVFGRPGGNSLVFDEDNDMDGEVRPFLGVTSKKSDKGVIITDVAKESAAEKAGLKDGDIITSIDNKKISDPENLADVVTGYKPKQEVKINFERNGKASDTKAVLGERKEGRLRSFFYNGDKMPGMDGEMLKDFSFDMPNNSDMPFNKFPFMQNKKIGVRIEDTENENGANVTNVEQGSAAEKAGLKLADIITEVDGKKVKDVQDAREQILNTEKSSYTIKAKRNGADMTFTIKIPKKLNTSDL